MKNRWEQNPYPDRGHRHRWKLTKDTPATKPNSIWTFGFGSNVSQPLTAAPRTLIRECEDCAAKQTAEVEDESVLVKGHENIADVEWKDLV